VSVQTFAGAPRGKGRRRVCLYSFHIANLFTERPAGMVGGAEVQLRLLATHLAARFDVHIVTVAPAQEAPLRVPAGMTLHVASPGHAAAGNRWRIFARRHLAIWRGFRRARAFAYLQRGAGFATFLTRLYAGLHRAAFVYQWASDDDAHGTLVRDFRGAWPLFRLARRTATAQVCQTRRQLGLLGRRERRRATVIPNVLDDGVAWRVGNGGDVLWVGSIKPEAKRPDRFLDLAAALPHRRFRMVGQLQGPSQFQGEMRARMAGLPNLNWVGFVERAGLPEHYAAARCLVNTSDFEGFPNSFLEACASGVPVVSLNVDPNGILAEQGAGRFLAGDASALAPAVQALFEPGPWERARSACLAVAAAHRPAAGAARLGDLLEALR
jgi:glycosyltransferase involved in cell wall biosynthesis